MIEQLNGKSLAIVQTPWEDEEVVHVPREQYVHPAVGVWTATMLCGSWYYACHIRFVPMGLLGLITARRLVCTICMEELRDGSIITSDNE